MPLIGVECPVCGYVEDLVSVANAPKIGSDYNCPECGASGKSCYTKGTTDCGEHTRLSRALGVHPDLIANGEAFKIHPGANFVKTDGGMYALEIKGRGEKIRRMRERAAYTGKGFVERD
jgi:rubredoxin